MVTASSIFFGRVFIHSLVFKTAYSISIEKCFGEGILHNEITRPYYETHWALCDQSPFSSTSLPGSIGTRAQRVGLSPDRRQPGTVVNVRMSHRFIMKIKIKVAVSLGEGRTPPPTPDRAHPKRANPMSTLISGPTP